jgi:hypothetical protein
VAGLAWGWVAEADYMQRHRRDNDRRAGQGRCDSMSFNRSGDE